jgi:hypothetical protein
MEDGYIKGNSFRGNRSQFYHTYGVNATLGYIWIKTIWCKSSRKYREQNYKLTTH